MESSLLYKGQLYRESVEKRLVSDKPRHVLYTLQVQPPRSKSKVDANKLLFDLIGRAPDGTDESAGSIEYTWGCGSEEECRRHQYLVHKKFPGAMVDYFPAV